ncbi:MAG: PQQ-binding-like beta-propeller repeat protein [Candidatus Omnitrophica bacterium]|nr:PQQ-binding-like beta-propeller repeat protein [Candidatus Omnitrophota bacterium]
MLERQKDIARAYVVVLVSALLAIATGDAADQPQWGQRYSRNMVSDETGLPDTFDPATGKNIKWSVPLGTQTYSTPVIANGKVLVGTNNDDPRDPRNKGDRGVLMCFNEKDGSFCWQLAVPKLTKSPYWDWPHNGMVSAATVESNRVYMVSNRGEVMCLDLDGMANGNDGPYVDEARHVVPSDAPPIEPGPSDGDIIWLFDMPKELGVRQHDAGHCSILVGRQYLYVCTANGVDDPHTGIECPDAPSLVVFEKTTGRLVAMDNERIGPRIPHGTWAPPSLGKVNGRSLVFFGGGDGVAYAFEAVETSPPKGQVDKLKRVWRFDCDPTGPKEKVQRYLHNKREGPSTIAGMPVFYQNRIYVAAGGDFWVGKARSWLKCIDATQTGDITSSGEVWSYPMRSQCLSTPSICNGLVFIAETGRKIHCLDANTGHEYWTHEVEGEIWGSTLVADGKVYAGTRRGDFWILAADKEKRVISTVQFDDQFSNSPAAANGVLYIAAMTRLYAIQADAR